MIEVWPGKPFPRGATYDGAGVNFSVYSRVATRVEICLYDPQSPEREHARFDLPEVHGFTWHGYVPRLEPGMLYGLRVHGPYDPSDGQRCNPHKLLVDPYARAIHGSVDWRGPVHGYVPPEPGEKPDDLEMDERDSARAVPKGVIVSDTFDWQGDRPLDLPWRKTVLYELHVRGFTRRHPGIPEELRGTYAGLAHPAAIEHLTKLGVTAVELLPVHASTDETFLEARSLSNYWGYSTLGFFAPEARYASSRRPGAQVNEFKAMVKALHAAGIEVILDVVYNHTCEGSHHGATLSLKGIDNASYYWLMPDRRYYLDFSGCGNSLNAANPETARFIADSLRYWVSEMHVDGFRFDLATTLGRVPPGHFDRDAPLFQIITQDPVLSSCKLIAEPWDCGLGGYQVGNFPAPFREWNGKYRDALRRYWKGDDNSAGEVGYRLTGSSDLYQEERRRPQASINFVTAHDGFTLHDLVTYTRKHNDANGEGNRDGHDDNRSWNYGVEGETDDPQIVRLRERQKRNLLATLLLSQGVPMLLAGDEMGRTQHGNNNAYCQDNGISWLDWQLDEKRNALLEFTRKLIAFRHRHPVLQRRRFFRGDFIWDSRWKDLCWYRPDGSEMSAEDWQQPFVRSLSFALGGDAIPSPDERGQRIVGDALLVLLNAHHEPMTYKLPEGDAGAGWTLELDTSHDAWDGDVSCTDEYVLPGHALAVFRQPSPPMEAVVAVPETGERATSKGLKHRRRAGVLVPLFSLRSKDSWGCGSVADLVPFARWASQAGFSLVQLLPVNETSGGDPSPYAAASAFALDPVYLSLDDCLDFVAAGGKAALPAGLRAELEAVGGSKRVEWVRVRALKKAAARIAFERFLTEEWRPRTRRARSLAAYRFENRAWLEDHALFGVLHDRMGGKPWTEWPESLRRREPSELAHVSEEHQTALLERAWLQWQLDEQWRRVRGECAALGVSLMGDLPFVVATDSADLWARPEAFRPDLTVGTPPDMFSETGQDWGLPAYDWDSLERSGYAYLRARAARAGELYAAFRVDHVIGLYRTFVRTGRTDRGHFWPAQEPAQIALGENVLKILRSFGEVVAEDLGAVPRFLPASLGRLGVPGYRVLRWEKEEDGKTWRLPSTWPVQSAACNGTHDTDSSAEWYESLPAAERESLAEIPGLEVARKQATFDGVVRDALLAVLYGSPSELVLVPFQDLFGHRERVNVPGTVSEANWTYRLPVTNEALAEDKAGIERLRKLAHAARRLPGRP